MHDATHQSFKKTAWLFYGIACLFPYLVGVYLILDLKALLSYTIFNILALTFMLILLGGLVIEAFSSRLKYLARRISLAVETGVSEKIEERENDLEEVHVLTQNFNTITGELDKHKKHSKVITAKMLSYVNDLEEYEKKLRDESLIRANLSRYVGKDVVDELLRSDRPAFENVECTATILFADIRRFTTLSENMEPEQTITILNNYFEAMVPIIFKYNGVLDKFVGDELMAVFRDHPYGERAPLRAIKAAIDMIETLENLKGTLGGDYSNLDVGIGINTGKVVIGNVGSENRKDYTAIGDTVNVAARLEQMAGCQEVIIGEATYEICKEQIQMKETGEIILKNRNAPVHAYKVIKKKIVS